MEQHKKCMSEIFKGIHVIIESCNKGGLYMKAIIQKIYGGPEMLEVVEVPKPTIDEKSVLIEVHIANIASGDMRVNTLDVPFGLKTIMKLVMGWKGPRKTTKTDDCLLVFSHCNLV